MEEKAQGAIEYLLIIAVAILVVAIVILAVTGVLTGGQDQGTDALTAEQEAQMGLGCQSTCDFTMEGVTGTCSSLGLAGCAASLTVAEECALDCSFDAACSGLAGCP